MALKWFISSTEVFGYTENVALPSREIGTSTSGSSSSQNKGKLFQGNLEGFKDGKEQVSQIKAEEYSNGFQMPLHYPRYRKSDYEKMEEWKLDLLLVSKKTLIRKGLLLWEFSCGLINIDVSISLSSY